MDCDQENDLSEESYMKLKPNDASLVDLFRFILPSGSKNIRKLIDFPRHEEEESYTANFGDRWTLFVSILLQKFLLSLTNPLAIVGALRSSVQGFYLKFIIGEWMVVPAGSTLPEMRSADWEIMDVNDDDDTMNSEEKDFKYYSSLTMMASKLAYQDYSLFVPHVVTNYWKMQSVKCHEFWNEFQQKASTHAFTFETRSRERDVTVVAFRGTNPFVAGDWMVDFNFSWLKIKGVGNIHHGFMEALGLQNKPKGWPKNLPNPQHDFAYYTLRQSLKQISTSNPNAQFIFTGHSLGGALAILFLTLLSLHEETTILNKIQAVYTYGQPRVGDRDFAKFMVRTLQTNGIQYYRFVYSFDLVPRVPFDSTFSNFKHFGGCVYFNSFYDGKFLMHQPNTNYFSVIWMIPKYLCAWWELMRCLIITPLVKGGAYFEGFGTVLERVIGLFIPGLSAHICPNYVNSTRWGKIHLPDRNGETRRLIANHIEADVRKATSTRYKHA